MIPIKEILDELGGRNLSVLALVCILLYVGGSQYLGTVEARFTAISKQVAVLETRQQRDDHAYNERFTSHEGQALRHWLKSIEEELGQHEGIPWHGNVGLEIDRLKRNE